MNVDFVKKKLLMTIHYNIFTINKLKHSSNTQSILQIKQFNKTVIFDPVYIGNHKLETQTQPCSLAEDMTLTKEHSFSETPLLYHNVVSSCVFSFYYGVG